MRVERPAARTMAAMLVLDGDIRHSRARRTRGAAATTLYAMEHITDPAWQRRYDRAAHMLDSVRGVVARQRAVERGRPHAPPRAEVRVGRTALRTAMHVGHFAGSFNPLTNAHVAIEEAARVAGGLDGVVWACAAVTVDKERVGRARVADRLGLPAAYAHGAPGRAGALANTRLSLEHGAALPRGTGPQ